VTDHDRRAVVLLVWLAIAGGAAALVELAYLAIRWALGTMLRRDHL
jgi:hypothetical protein